MAHETMQGSIVVDDADAEIAIIRLSNPGRLNSMSLAMWRQLTATLGDLQRKRDLRCIVITGAGTDAFAAGSDIHEFKTDRANVAQAAAYGKMVSDGLDALANCPLPMVAMIRGTCVGGGLAIASWCDVRVCGDSSRFGVPVGKLGLVMAHAEMRGVLRLAGPAVLKEILLEGRIFNAGEALQKGLVNRIVADDEVEREALATARRIAGGAPLVARWHKKFIERLADPSPLTAAETDEAYACFGSSDYQIGFQAFVDKAVPKFRGE